MTMLRCTRTVPAQDYDIHYAPAHIQRAFMDEDAVGWDKSITKIVITRDNGSTETWEVTGP